MRILVAMSGGVDSSVSAAHLVEQGHDVIGMSLQLAPSPPDHPGPDHKADARAVCDQLGIPFRIVDAQERFASTIIDYFVSAYHAGRTPSPCVRCNPRIKFSTLLEVADELGADKVATGHYARVAKGDDGRWHLYRGADPSRDQTYYLCRLEQRWLERIVFPVGEMTKPDVRAYAARLGLVVADKQDSQELCFVPENRYVPFVEQWGGPGRPGNIVDRSGKVLGEHKGLHRYTIGQRRGLGIAAGKPLYVLDIDAERNEVVVGDNEHLFQRVLTARDCSWITGEAPGERLVQAKIRYRAPAAPAVVEPLDEHTCRVTFEQPQRAITPGQAVVFYDGEEVLGGGWIEDAWEA